MRITVSLKALSVSVTIATLSAAIANFTYDADARSKVSRAKGYNITATGLRPHYPSGFKCSPLTSLYASMIDVDGSRRSRHHSGIDAGKLGDPIFAPASGIIKAVWRANWGWGDEGALLIRHSRRDLGFTRGAPFYYTAFNHLLYNDIKHLKPGARIRRGQRLAKVSRPGGKKYYLPEVHIEVYEVNDRRDRSIKWRKNKHGRMYWRNSKTRIIDPLYMFSFQSPATNKRRVNISIYTPGKRHIGFTYFLPCKKQ